MDLKTLVEEFDKLRREVVGKLDVHEKLQVAANLLHEVAQAVDTGADKVEEATGTPEQPAETPAEQPAENVDGATHIEVQEG